MDIPWQEPPPLPLRTTLPSLFHSYSVCNCQVKSGDKPEMIDCEAIKERIYYAMPAHKIQVNILAQQLHMHRNKVAFFLRLLKVDGKVEYLGRRYDPSVKMLRAFWKRK